MELYKLGTDDPCIFQKIKPNFKIIVADFLAIIPTITKTWDYPATESVWIYITASICNIIGLATLRAWSLETAGFSMYLSLMGILMIGVIIHKKLARSIERFI